VIELIGSDFVPVWIDVRTTSLPRRAFVGDVLVNARVDEQNKVVDPFSQGFFLRSVVLTPDGEQILNRAPTTAAASLGRVLTTGDNLYANVDAGDYLTMLRHALVRLHAGPDR
jgi:hypothetical protein